MFKIVLNGCCGKMGHSVIQCVNERSDCEIVAGVDKVRADGVDFPVYSSFFDISEEFDVIIDFSHPSVLSDLLEFCVSKNVPAVIATTGFSETQVENIKSAAKTVPIFFSANMSLCVNLLTELAKKAASVLGNFDIEIVEKHHNQKIDAPSGTALMIADAINAQLNNRFEYVYDRNSKSEKRSKNEIGIHAVRGGNITGQHDIIFAGHDEVLTLSHSATSKAVFASSSINAAQFLIKKEIGLYNMGDLINS
ncbi:MAG: 4-hydroxy-tetrahydrodipicolinate reductase [bacterium]|nr:4-hydroxy-tetrahydrodipicolinate reductase [bacterium]